MRSGSSLRPHDGGYIWSQGVHVPHAAKLLRVTLGTLAWWALSPLAAAETIEQVLQRSQAQRLAERGEPAPGQAEAVERLRASVARLQAQQPALADVRLLVVGGGLFAEAVFGQRALAASAAVGELPEGERLLMLAHEFGHLQLHHWEALSALYHQHIPGEVRPETTDGVAGPLADDARRLSWQHEFEADAWGFRVVRPLAHGVETAQSLLTRQGVLLDSATHPGTRRRLLQLRQLGTELDHPQLRYAPALTAEGGSVVR